MTSSLLILILTSVVFISESAVTVTQEKNEESGKMQLVVHGVKVEHGRQETKCRRSWTRGDKARTTPEGGKMISDTCYRVTTDGDVKLGDYTGKSEEEITALGEKVKTYVQNDNFYISKGEKLVDSPELIVKQEEKKIYGEPVMQLSFAGVSIEYGKLYRTKWTKDETKTITTPKEAIAFQKITDERYAKDIFSIIKKDEKYPQTLGYYIGPLAGKTAAFMNRNIYTDTKKVEHMTMKDLMQKIEDGHLYIGSPDGPYTKTTRKLIRSKPIAASAVTVTQEKNEESGKMQLVVHGVSVEHGTQKTECLSSWTRRKPKEGDKTAKGGKYPIPIGTDTCFAVTSDGVIRLGAYTGESAKFGERVQTDVQNDNFYITKREKLVARGVRVTQDSKHLILYGISFERGKLDGTTWTKNEKKKIVTSPMAVPKGSSHIFTIILHGSARTLGSYIGKGTEDYKARFKPKTGLQNFKTMSTLMQTIEDGHLYTGYTDKSGVIIINKRFFPAKSEAASASATAHDEYSNIYDVMYDVWHEYNMLLRDYEMHLEKEEKRERLAEILLKHKRQNILRQRKRIEAFI